MYKISLKEKRSRRINKLCVQNTSLNHMYTVEQRKHRIKAILDQSSMSQTRY